MTEVPKIVYDRLRATSPELAHPDANLLTAFAEQSLLGIERDDLVKHLALCEDCREVLVLALPPVEAEAIAAIAKMTAPIAADAESDRITRISTKTKKSWITVLAGPSMRWAALAAGVVVAASLLLMHPGKLNQPIAPSVNQPVATTAAITASPASQAEAKTDDAQLPKKQSSKKLNAVENSTAESVSRGVTENAGISGEAASSVEGTQMARNDAPVIEKAKPALQQSEATEKAVPNELQKNQPELAQVPDQTLPHSVTWAIMAGILQRSQNNGQNWQSALHADHPLLCYASRGEDVWAGGKAGTLFHSIDNGITWVQLQPSVKDQKLGADITHIDIHDTGIHGNGSGPTQIVVLTSNNEVWTSADSGNTWRTN
jgi:hypothetical protein